MSNIAIHFDHVGKLYQLGGVGIGNHKLLNIKQDGNNKN